MPQTTTFPTIESVPVQTAPATTGFANQFTGNINSSRGIFGKGENTVIIGATEMKTNNFVSNSTGWRLTYAGDFEGNSGTFRGTLSATSGSIGGWTIGATSLTAGTGASTVGLDSGGTNPAFYAGSATPTSAPFQVFQDGTIDITGATITAGTFQTASSGQRVSLTGVDNALRFYDASNNILMQFGATTNPIVQIKSFSDVVDLQFASKQ